MAPQPALDKWGIARQYTDGLGQSRTVPARTREAIRLTMGDPPKTAGEKYGIEILKPGRKLPLKHPATLMLEDGTELTVEKFLPSDLPVGYHELIGNKGHRKRLLVTPGECYLPDNLMAWGWGVQLYSLRSRQSWGIGDLKDLRTFGRWAARTHGCGYILANPLAAPLPILPQQTSPYYPSSRRFLNPLYLCLEEISGYNQVITPKIIRHGRELNGTSTIDREAVFRLKLGTLHQIWRNFRGDRRFEKFCERGGRSLVEYAKFCTLAEHFGGGWTSWPEAYRRPDALAVGAFTQERADRVHFHQWLQWLLHEQLKRAVKALPLVHDLPIGIDPAGADAWVWQDVLARDMDVGAPPDGYNRNGQNWGVQPFIPQRLREMFYEPFRETLRAVLRFGGGLRIDHVMGLSRLFWIPKNCPAREGAYVYYPMHELMAILAIESHRARAWIIGEDLGTVEPEVRREMRRRKILSCRVLWFEGDSTRRFARRAMASVTTHDLPTIAGLWNGADVAAQEKAGLQPDLADAQSMKRKLSHRLRLKPSAPVGTAITATYKNLSRAPSQLLTATLEDALAVAERPNLPGTTTQWPNWSLALPLKLEQIIRNSLVHEVAKLCGVGRGGL